MSEALYTSLRDETAANLIAQFGRGGILRQVPEPNYDPKTGKTSPGAPVDTNVKVIEVGLAALLKGRDGKNQFVQEDGSAMWDSGLIMSAKETSAAGVEPAVGNSIILGGRTCRIEWIEPVAPSGIPIIYKMAIARK